SITPPTILQYALPICNVAHHQYHFAAAKGARHKLVDAVGVIGGAHFKGVGEVFAVNKIHKHGVANQVADTLAAILVAEVKQAGRSEEHTSELQSREKL